MRWHSLVEYLQLRLAWPNEPFHSWSELRYKPQLLRAHSVWEQAFATLVNVDVWIVVGYSMPEYDTEVRRLFSAADHRQHVIIYDPSAERVASAFSAVSPMASFEFHPGLAEDRHDLRRRRRRVPLNRRRSRARRPSMGGKDSNRRPTDYESSRNRSIEQNLAR